jgi:transcription elongation GreA/GreB family factor
MSAAPARRKDQDLQTPTEIKTRHHLKDTLRVHLTKPLASQSLFAIPKKNKQIQKPAAIGDTIYLRYGTEIQRYHLVHKSDGRSKRQFLSADSPLGKAVIGRHVGEYILVKTKYGQFRFAISRIE